MSSCELIGWNYHRNPLECPVSYLVKAPHSVALAAAGEGMKALPKRLDISSLATKGQPAARRNSERWLEYPCQASERSVPLPPLSGLSAGRSGEILWPVLCRSFDLQLVRQFLAKRFFIRN